jgi:hypothetical protein
MVKNQSLLVLGGTAILLLFLVFLGVRNYEGNASALLHMNKGFGEMHRVPAGVVLYREGAYDGMLYYQVARDIPALFSGGETSYNMPYRFQRIVLPLLAYMVVLGNESYFAQAMLGINIAAALGTLALMLALTRRKVLHAAASVFNPAMLVGILYMVTEPVSIFFITLFFFFWLKRDQRLDFFSLSALTLALFARETTVFLIGLLFLWSIFHRRWKEMLLILIPMALFFLWQYFLDVRLGAVAFQANSNIVAPPFGGPLTLIQLSLQKLTTYRLSSLGLLLFVIPLCVVLGKEWIEKKQRMGLLCFLLSGLVFTMLCMDSHMWGALTSIGRVVTPVYPVYVLYAAERDTWVERSISAILIVMSIVAAIFIASVPHTYVIS